MCDVKEDAMQIRRRAKDVCGEECFPLPLPHPLLPQKVDGVAKGMDKHALLRCLPLLTVADIVENDTKADAWQSSLCVPGSCLWKTS